MAVATAAAEEEGDGFNFIVSGTGGIVVGNGSAVATGALFVADFVGEDPLVLQGRHLLRRRPASRGERRRPTCFPFQPSQELPSHPASQE